VCFLANVGQVEPWDEVEKKALKIGALKMVCFFLCRCAFAGSKADCWMF
jgi:argininosuccinate synthase